MHVKAGEAVKVGDRLLLCLVEIFLIISERIGEVAFGDVSVRQLLAHVVEFGVHLQSLLKLLDGVVKRAVAHVCVAVILMVAG